MYKKTFWWGSAVVVALAFWYITIPLGSAALSSHQANADIAAAKGTAEINGTFLQVTLDRPVVKACGDTELLVFLSLDNGVQISLDPTFIPAQKTETMTMNKSFFFSLLKAAPFLGDGHHKIEMFVRNNCSMFGNKSIALQPLPLVIGEGI